MPNLRIALVQESANQVYYSGNTITGNLLLVVNEPKSYKHVSVQFVGKSYVHWTESRTEGSGNNQRTVTYSYTSTEPYVDLVATVWNNQQSPDGKLAPGQYSWPFVINIPPTVPSSFEGSVGHIRYNLLGRIGTGALKFDHVVEVRIPVQQLLSITDPRLLQPQRQEVQKRVCCLCCASQPIVLNVSVPKTGFCIGDSFPLHVSLENGSRRRITMTAAINQKVTYFAQGHQHWGGKTLINVGSDQIEPWATRNWDPNIQIPPTDIVDESSCRNIKVAYSLTVTARIPRALNLSTTIPLQLGNCRQQEGPNPNPVPPTQPTPQQGPVFPQHGAFPPAHQQPPPGAAPSLAPYNYPPPTDPPPAYRPPGSNPTVTAPIGWSMQPDSNIPVATGSGFPPPTFEKPSDTLADIPV